MTDTYVVDADTVTDLVVKARWVSGRPVAIEFCHSAAKTTTEALLGRLNARASEAKT